MTIPLIKPSDNHSLIDSHIKKPENNRSTDNPIKMINKLTVMVLVTIPLINPLIIIIIGLITIILINPLVIMGQSQ